MFMEFMLKDGMSRYAPVVLRLGLAAVVLWFGMNELMSPAAWASYVPEWATSLSGLTPLTIVYLNGAFEVVAAILLALGVFVRTISFLLFAHLIVIVAEIGLNPTGVRDLGLAAGFLSLMLSGPDALSLGKK